MCESYSRNDLFILQNHFRFEILTRKKFKIVKAVLLKDTKFTGGIWQNFFDYFEFLSRENFQPKVLVQDKQIITAIGFAHQEFARKVILSLGLAENTGNYFKEKNEHSEEDLLFTLSDEEFDQVKRSIENTL